MCLYGHTSYDHSVYGGRRWMSHFIYGLPTIGKLSQNRLFMTSSKIDLDSCIIDDPRILFLTARGRFKQRARAMKIASAEKLRGEAMAHVQLGRLGPPEKLTDEWVLSITGRRR